MDHIAGHLEKLERNDPEAGSRDSGMRIGQISPRDALQEQKKEGEEVSRLGAFGFQNFVGEAETKPSAVVRPRASVVSHSL